MDTPAIPEKLLEFLDKEGVVAIATTGPSGPHLVNTWLDYVRLTADGRLLMPAGAMKRTEANIASNPDVMVTLGSRKVKGFRGDGAGFLIRGKADLLTSGPDFERMKERFGWMRAVIAVTIDSAEQTL